MMICNSPIQVHPEHWCHVWQHAELSAPYHRYLQVLYFQNRYLYRTRKYEFKDHAKILVHTFVTSRLDNCNSLLFGLPSRLIYKLQLVQNCAARLTLGGRKYDHITPLLEKLPWLPFEHRTVFSIASNHLRLYATLLHVISVICFETEPPIGDWGHQL